MADIRPLGSERLEGIDKIKRIMEISKYKEVSNETINENASTHYNITFADGNEYGIIKERQGYIIKQIVSEGQSDYIDQIKNRKYFSKKHHLNDIWKRKLSSYSRELRNKDHRT